MIEPRFELWKLPRGLRRASGLVLAAALLFFSGFEAALIVISGYPCGRLAQAQY